MADSRTGNGVCDGRKIMGNTNDDHINIMVSKEYLSELEDKARNVEWMRGYIQGIVDCVDFIVQIVQAARREQ